MNLKGMLFLIKHIINLKDQNSFANSNSGFSNLINVGTVTNTNVRGINLEPPELNSSTPGPFTHHFEVDPGRAEVTHISLDFLAPSGIYGQTQNGNYLENNVELWIQIRRRNSNGTWGSWYTPNNMTSNNSHAFVNPATANSASIIWVRNTNNDALRFSISIPGLTKNRYQVRVANNRVRYLERGAHRINWIGLRGDAGDTGLPGGITYMAIAVRANEAVEDLLSSRITVLVQSRGYILQRNSAKKAIISTTKNNLYDSPMDAIINILKILEWDETTIDLESLMSLKETLLSRPDGPDVYNAGIRKYYNSFEYYTRCFATVS